MGEYSCLFLDDIHTEASNQALDDLGNPWDYGSHNHFVDILGIVEKLPEGIDIVFNRTEHWKTSPDFFENLEKEVESRGGSFQRFERHVCFEVHGNRAAVINSVEASVEREDYHFLVSGLPLDKEVTYYNLSVEELLDAAEEAIWCSPAHVFAPNFKVPDSILVDFFEKAKDRDINSCIGYTTGYTRLFNRMAHGRLKRLHNIISGLVEFDLGYVLRNIFNPRPYDLYSLHDYAERFDLDIVPEMDMHTLVPPKLEGCGVMESGAMEDLRKGEMPVEKIFDSRLLSFSGIGKEGSTWLEFFQSFPGVLPFYRTGIYRPFLPYEREDFEKLREESMKSLKDLSKEDIESNNYKPIRAFE